MAPPDIFDSAGTLSPIRRDRWGRPLILPPGAVAGTKPKAYTRCTTYVDCLDDKFNLQQWEKRNVAIGLADRPDLVLAVAAHREDKKELNAITAKAQEAAQASAAATRGTALHALCEQRDRGRLHGSVPAAYQADLDAYHLATRMLRHTEIEQFGVLDDLKVAGTWDRLSAIQDQGELIIGDIKTGSIEWGALKIAMQLAIYAHAVPYNPATGERMPRTEPVNQQRAIVIHLPAGTGTCILYYIDIEAGWEAVQLAGQVREWRSRKGWLTPVATYPPSIDDAIAAAATLTELREVWTRAVTAGTWTDAHLAAALARKVQLDQEGIAA